MTLGLLEWVETTVLFNSGNIIRYILYVNVKFNSTNIYFAPNTRH